MPVLTSAMSPPTKRRRRVGGALAVAVTLLACLRLGSSAAFGRIPLTGGSRALAPPSRLGKPAAATAVAEVEPATSPESAEEAPAAEEAPVALSQEALREEAKAALVLAATAFREKQEQMWEMMDEQQAAEAAQKKKGGPSLLEAESFAAQKTVLTDELEGLRNNTVDAIHRLAALNPTEEPTKGWRGFGSTSPAECGLNGTWKLIFTDAADATFKKGKRGSANTFQEVDADGGWFVNCVDFDNPKSKLQGFRVFVEGDALSEKEMQLSFRKVLLLRRSRFPKLFGRVTIPLPNPKFLRTVGRLLARAMGGKPNPSDRGAGFTLLYLDGDLRIHQTFDGLFFVQKRLA